MKLLHPFGRFLQLVALIVLPSAIWAGHFGHNERAAIAIFLGSVGVFYAGFLMASRD